MIFKSWIELNHVSLERGFFIAKFSIKQSFCYKYREFLVFADLF